jgi:putative nucleotidyltransferase with HDIG domain
MMNLKAVEIRIARATTLPVLPHIVPQLLKLTTSYEATLRDYERVISQDSAIASKVLRVANSPLYGGRGVATLSKAVGMLGINTVRSIATTVAFQSALTNKNLPKKFSVSDYWQHSIAVACAAKVLACLKQHPLPEEVFIAGLMHDIGKMALALYLPAEANFVYQTMLEQKIGQYEAEKHAMGITHQDIGLLVARKWELPPAYHAAIATHHTPANGEGEIDLVAACVHVANCLAHAIEVQGDAASAVPGADPVILSYLAIPEAQFAPLKQVLAREIAVLSEHYALK